MMATNDLALIVCVNEDIKSVVKLARRINLLALNAILVSRRAGNVALGFGVIADELRGFSKNLTVTMQTLMKLSYQSVQTVSLYQRHVRMNKLILLAQEQLLTSSTIHKLQADDRRTHALRDDLLRTYKGLQKLIEDAEDASRFGSVIARSLKIEATYGNEFSSLLAQIAVEFSHYIDSIPDVLQRLNRNLQGTT